MKSTLSLMCLLLILHSSYLFADTKLSISYVEHPNISMLKKVIQSSYEQAGIQVTYKAAPQEKGLIAINEGIVDGDVARSINGITRYENLLQVGKPLVTANYYLICRNGKACDESLLEQSETEILMSAGSIKGMPKDFRKKFKAQAYLLDNFRTFTKLLLAHKFDYAIITYDANTSPEKLFKGYQSVPIYSVDIYHVLHKKHAQIAKVLGPILNEKVKTLGLR